MKFQNIVVLFVLGTLACHFNSLMAEDGGAAKRLALRRPIGGKIAGKPASSTTTSQPLSSNDDDEGDYGEGEQDPQYADENDDAALSSSTTTKTTTTTTTTEAPKRIGPVIRPFRSNDDFLNSLKRRQMNAKRHKSEKPLAKDGGSNSAQDTQEAEASTKTFSKPNGTGNRNRKFNKTIKTENEDSAVEEAESEQKEQKEDGKFVGGKRPTAGRLSLKKRN